MYKIKAYVQHGYFEYMVPTMAAALEHGEVIMANRTYRRSIGKDTVEIHHVYKVKIVGPGLKSEYLDEFKRT